MLNKIILIVAIGLSYTALADDNVPITLNNCTDRPVTSTSALIEEGRRLFKEETFNGNGRTCETCHRENHNLTIDKDFISKLPTDDPLFVAENNSALQNLENPKMLREFGLITLHSDGFDKPPVLRGVPHLLGLRQTTALGLSELKQGETKPIHETGWSADGALGDRSLRCFAAGAVVQHFTKSMNRVNGDDFRLPTEHELDALLVYQLSLGRQETPKVSSLTFLEPAAERGKTLFFGDIQVRGETLNLRQNNCSQCHIEAGANNGATFQARNGVTNANLSPNAPICKGLALNPPLGIPADGGFGNREFIDNIACGAQNISVKLYSEQVQNPHGFFNTPSLFESADTGPFFHNNSSETLEDAIKFYSSDEFNTSDGANGRAFIFGPTDLNDIGAFLRAINALENAQMAIKHIDNVLAASGNQLNAEPLRLALADSRDGIEVLTTGPLPNLFPEAVGLFHDANRSLLAAIASGDEVAANQAKTKLAAVRSKIVTDNSAPPPPLADVIVTQLSYANGVFTTTVKNQGTAATPSGTVIGVGYLVDSVQRTWGAVTGPLAAGASVTIGTNGGSYAIPTGTHTMVAWVDDNNRFAESDETNNQLSQSITVGTPSTLPDVIVTSFSYTNGVFKAMVQNQGTAATPSGTVIGVGYLVDGVQRTWGAVTGPLAAGASVTIGTNGGSYAIPTGTHTMVAWVDDNNRFAESDETNNQLSQSITVGTPSTLPDVIVTSFSYTNGVFKAMVQNQGTAATPSGTVIGVGYLVDGVQRTWGAVTGPLAAGASVTIGTNGGSYAIPTGTHTMVAWVDDNNRFAESDETNNQLSQSINVP